MSIRKLWDKFLVWAEYKKGEKPIEIEKAPEEIPEPIAQPRVVTHQEAVRMKHGREGKEALFECFYGTLVDRDPSDGSLKKKKHAHDGWREGHSNPFIFGGRTYDVQKRRDDSRAQFEELMKKLTEMEAGG